MPPDYGPDPLSKALGDALAVVLVVFVGLVVKRWGGRAARRRVSRSQSSAAGAGGSRAGASKPHRRAH